MACFCVYNGLCLKYEPFWSLEPDFGNSLLEDPPKACLFEAGVFSFFKVGDDLFLYNTLLVNEGFVESVFVLEVWSNVWVYKYLLLVVPGGCLVLLF